MIIYPGWKKQEKHRVKVRGVGWHCRQRQERLLDRADGSETATPTTPTTGDRSKYDVNKVSGAPRQISHRTRKR